MEKIFKEKKFKLNYYIYLYKDDLQELLKILSKYFSKIEASSENYRLNDNLFQLDDYLKLPNEEISTLSINASRIKNHDEESPYSSITISFNGYHTISASSPSHLFTGIVNEIEDIFRNKKRIFVSFMMNFKGFLSTVIIIEICFYGISILTNPIVFPILSTFSIFLGFTYSYLMQLILKAKHKVIFINKYSSEQKSFLERNLDQILTQSLGKFLAGIFLLLLGMVLDHYLHPFGQNPKIPSNEKQGKISHNVKSK